MLMSLDSFISMLEEDFDVEVGYRSGFVVDGNFEGEADIELVEQDGGGEGGSEDCYSVFRVEDKFYEVTYNYYSHDGFNYDYSSVRQVFPKQKLITVYE